MRFPFDQHGPRDHRPHLIEPCRRRSACSLPFPERQRDQDQQATREREEQPSHAFTLNSTGNVASVNVPCRVVNVLDAMIVNR